MNVNEIPEGWQGLDAGQNHCNFEKVIMESKTILWNGPLGVLKWKVLLKDYCLGNFITKRQRSKDTFSLAVTRYNCKTI
jgi:phosphoglycerate kinase